MPINKVANIIKKNIGNYSSSIGASSFQNVISGATRGSAAATQAAAKILNKSPLEINDDTPQQLLTRNPYEYGTVYYPQDITNLGTGHYMIFDIFKNKDSVTRLNNGTSNRSDPTNTVGERDIRAQNLERRRVQAASGVRTRGNARQTHAVKQVEDSIVLYTPPQVKTSYGSTFDQAETGLAGFLGPQLGAAANNLADRIGKGLSGDFKGAVSNFDLSKSLQVGGEAAKAITRGIVSAGLSLIPGGGDYNSYRTVVSGQAVNPNLEVAFKSVPFRKFSYSFDFAPRNEKEKDQVNKIIQLFKFHMQPDIPSNNQDLYLVTPSEFQITYMYLDNINNYIPRISRCVLESMELDQSPEGVFTTFKGDDGGAFPVLTRISLSFLETEIMTKKRAAEGF
jgi:hypothetical protein